MQCKDLAIAITPASSPWRLGLNLHCYTSVNSSLICFDCAKSGVCCRQKFFHKSLNYDARNSKNLPLVTGKPVEVQDFKKITDLFRGIHGLYLKLIKENWTIATCPQFVSSEIFGHNQSKSACFQDQAIMVLTSFSFPLWNWIMFSTVH